MKTVNRKYGIYALSLLIFVAIAAIPIIKNIMAENIYIFSAYWLALIILIYAVFPRVYVKSRRVQRKLMGIYALSGAIIYISIHFVLGVILQKLAGSPYDKSFMGFLLNVITIMLPLIVKESTRSYCLGLLGRKKRYRLLLIVLLTIFMASTEINFGKFFQINSYKDLFIYVVKDVIPVFTGGILLTSFVIYAGAGPAIIYTAFINLFLRIFPFLPDLPWIADAAVGICFPVLYALFIKDQQGLIDKKERGEEYKLSFSYLAQFFAAIMFYWFCIGVFSIYPTVILTGSMEPGIMPGDAVIIKRVAEEDDIYKLAVGDVINFKRDDINITHRIVKIDEDSAGNRQFVTKGDNNKSEDVQPVMPNDVNGTVIKVVPKIGIPVLLLRGNNDIPDNVVDK